MTDLRVIEFYEDEEDEKNNERSFAVGWWNKSYPPENGKILFVEERKGSFRIAPEDVLSDTPKEGYQFR